MKRRRIHINQGATTLRCVAHKYSTESRIISHWCSPSLAGPVRRYITGKYGVNPTKRSRKRYMHIDPGGMLFVEDPIVDVTIDAGGHPFILSTFEGKIGGACHMLERARAKQRFGMCEETVRIPSFCDVMLVMRPEERDQAVLLLDQYLSDAEEEWKVPEPTLKEIAEMGEF